MELHEGPVQNEYQAIIAALAHVIDSELNPDGIKAHGFALLIFPFGQPSGAHRCNYASNADRSDMVATMREFIARSEGTYGKEKYVKFPLEER